MRPRVWKTPWLLAVVVIGLLVGLTCACAQNRVTVQGMPCRYEFSWDALKLDERSFDWIQLGMPASDILQTLGKPSGELRPNYTTDAYYRIGFNRYVVLLFAPSKESGENIVTRVYLADKNRIIKVLQGYDKTGLYDNATPFTQRSDIDISDAWMKQQHTLDELKQLLGELPPIRQARAYYDYTVVWCGDNRLYYLFFRADGCMQAETNIVAVVRYPHEAAMDAQQVEESYQKMLYDQIWEKDYPEVLLAGPR